MEQPTPTRGWAHKGRQGHRAHPPVSWLKAGRDRTLGAARSRPSPAWGWGVALLLALPAPPALSSSGRSPSLSQERRLLPDSRGMVSGGSLQVMRRRSSSSPSSGTNFHLEPFGTTQALVLARSAGVGVGHPPPPCCFWGQQGTGTSGDDGCSQPVVQERAEELGWCTQLVVENGGTGGSSTPRLFSSSVSIMTKGEDQSPTTRLALHEDSATIVLCSGEVSSLLDVHSGWSPDAPITLLSEKTRDSLWVPGEPSREDPTDTSHRFTHGSCPSTRAGSQPHSVEGWRKRGQCLPSTAEFPPASLA